VISQQLIVSAVGEFLCSDLQFTIVMPISLLIYGCKLAERTRIPQ
jgi:hypothetical protein